MSPSTNPKPFVQPGDALADFLRRFWQRQVNTAEREDPDFKHPSLPLARIKKVMKSDPDVKVMIASDAPILFCKACEMFISEMTSRAFLIADSNKRRTLSRADISKALAKSDQFDFLIDIVPREDPLGVPSASALTRNRDQNDDMDALTRGPSRIGRNITDLSADQDGDGDVEESSVLLQRV